MVLTSTHNLCFEQEYEKYQSFFLSGNFQFLESKFSTYLNRRVFVMVGTNWTCLSEVIQNEYPQDYFGAKIFK